MTTTPDDHASSDDRDDQDPTGAPDIDDSRLPEDLQPSENPLAAEPGSDSDAPGDGSEPPD